MGAVPHPQASAFARPGWSDLARPGSGIVPRLGPVRRDDLIRYLKQLGFSGPWSGGKHAFMERCERSIRIPNPHQGDIGRELLVRILRQAGISAVEWERL
ncbi:MAG: type II toxin-antitoxin system HicA family toxin [Magnetococcus sp. DMHC-8]